MSWFWFVVSVLMLAWNVFLMRCNHEQARIIRRQRRAQLAQDPEFLLHALRRGDRS